MTTTLFKLAEIAGGEIIGDGETTVEAITLDSRRAEAEYLFAAVPGTRSHGATFAAATSAKAVLTDAAGVEILHRESAEDSFDRPIIVVENIRAVLGEISAEIYGHPTKKLTIFGVTGTSGKTTTTYLLETGLLAAGYSTGLIGTTGTRINRKPVETQLTTPEAPTLQDLFARMVAENVTHVVMEVSSHALELGRVQGVDFAVGGFTNLSQDHLDFHPTMEEYFAAKSKLFLGEEAARNAVVCINDEWGERLADLVDEENRPLTVVSTTGAIAHTGDEGGVAQADAMLRERTRELLVPGTVVAWQQAVQATGGQQVALEINPPENSEIIQAQVPRSFDFELPLPGDFNIANAGLAVGMASAAGIDLDTFIAALTQVAVPGRMQRIDEGQDFVAVVDYAHKPAAIEAVLDTLRSQLDSAGPNSLRRNDAERIGAGRIGVVVGAGGDRDSSKRGLMGAAAAKRADFVVVTDDNPRTEDPAPIRQAVMAGAIEAAEKAGRDVEFREIASRAEAIDEVVNWATSGDAVIVVGKGHEVGQLIGGTMHHFDDREELARALQSKRTAHLNTPITPEARDTAEDSDERQ
ncbi:UDP-N-acetylmuramoyl-L-alanyl-D-glutamate--2,6-diaminopimelate ligase [Corynebacterium stationis]|uniref:UDP-N-acetylmuramoyl-L-alanyl-D-glutamate--2, 6-diaminopimelate ligase n=1 Tax=Corynebacterium stationis TaxID=1705 RepID=UPI00076F8409|nr:UDP-N-acetylmuramoyl-L-alanyl-D-glutamate--2,6-diaminopimelate ligase [Corynebacterium stationis]AMJ44322.1 UDP-N-acetylmuramoyl-L-alanyl-D-glutamate--2,6-diaminopimelate ligase [Corynebacterium stationis]APT94674.1 UDP-N-acetylmuramoyl-L-alanyl-D-glutamate--2,6-diaminopimelate ligase [Corynebacterium stationis]AQX70778.1 UDP-N-acetylmuramoyl-L-alanyl-D-glutamate--2,6-diaminopimelate ligase [Corynebacterium stationis]ASJ18467.1 UDP-N-acetylmuramoyl-L-alanyl-D-glutamate--2,6-diaminopimelate l